MASEEKKKTLHELGIFQTRKPILSVAEEKKQPMETKKSMEKNEILPPLSPSTKNEKENEERKDENQESKKDDVTSSSSGFSSGTINRRRREIVIPIRPTGETYRRGGSFKERSEDPKPLDLMSTSMIVLPSEKRPFVVPQISLPRDLRSTSPPSQKIVMRKKKTDSDCTADTLIIAPKVKQTAVKTIVTPSPPAKESVQLSISIPKRAVPSDRTRREVEELRRKEEVKREEKKEEERKEILTDEVDALEAEIGRRLALISTKSDELSRNLENTQSAPLSPSSTASMQVVNTSSSSTLPRSITTVTQPIDLLPSSLPPKKKDDKMSEESKPRSSSGNLASRVKESIADFTTGSTDRLQRWKSKLHSTGRRIREKDSSAPPPLVRTMQSSSPEVLVDWSVRPRPLHITRSASNAMTVHENRMEHRTLKFSTQQPVYHNVHSRQSFNSDNLPPPARIVPFSGSRAHENSDIIRPIAYRAHGNEEMNRRPYPHKVELTKSALNLSTSGVAISRPRAVFPSTSNSFSVVRHENEYDTVSDIMVDKEKSNSDGGSDYCKFSASSGSNGGSIGNSRRSQIFQKTTSRQSTGAHITPSPSDSGIVDYETMIRDKENELADVRKTMEQNEEIIVKVYLEKERSWKDQLEQMRNRLMASEKGESALRMQVANLSRQTEAMTSKVEKLEEDKSRMAARIRDLESRECESCSSHPHHRQSPPSNGKPVPAPRTFKSSSGTDIDLRDEVSELRREVSTLKDALQFIPESKRNAIYANNNSISLRDRLI
ncbi:hypothetical protein PMAYCL1PPCAC_02280 [Pristionchus mayeri]|uniref:Uncharacterized protein n=1 Tax=Pristionchus mayeri TaxID=1317129 RepID=A0AAN4Z7T7_9BILA|nr:hypothetical protein PMAYCL1PPCAC_02280 [Pristionchus mayeri]